jgi:hypothetical protein
MLLGVRWLELLSRLGELYADLLLRRSTRRLTGGAPGCWTLWAFSLLACGMFPPMIVVEAIDLSRYGE